MAEKGQSQKLKNPEDVRFRREQVLTKYQGFKEAARQRREKLEAAKKFQQFKRDASELEAWINEKIHVVSDESYKDRTNLQVLKFGVLSSAVPMPLGGGACLCACLSPECT